MRFAYLLNIVLLILLIKYSKCGGRKSQFDFNCPTKCQCNQTHFICKNTQKVGHSMFLAASPKLYPNLDTLEITGNNIGDLSETSFFDQNNIRHLKVTWVNISSNHITSIGHKTLIGFPKVEYFYLSNNEILHVGDTPLEYQKNLRMIDLTNAFSKKLSSKEKADIIRDLFKTKKNDFPDLNKVILNNNDIEFLHPETFCPIRGLVRLELKNNKLKSFDFNGKNCLPGLEFLDLTNNKIEIVSSHMWNDIENLHDLDIAGNPLICSCENNDLLNFASKYAEDFIDSGKTLCHSPNQFAGKSIFDLQKQDCSHVSSGKIFKFLILLLLSSIFLGAYFTVRSHRPNLCSKLPFNIGYTKLRGGNGNRGGCDDDSIPFTRSNNAPVFL
ncbi:Cysteine-rich flanking region, C-terminal domain and Leucine-rich repeat, typical subtype-containing protein [Strongyloides ratti]|uniref:Cysteine-rich flanking region, C-terminal domain and Leucine-rich repeat, typical subtype-containing protein n=1 Tax=Strongyloides ratti TaxID=34506 RepID=A0A090LCH4_STRRB|nr:Cysteine-rich flanking region, C-terminal domain and Leucine-rich repeat, typical subtype-containing protein [Strongyloides ratti]CEF67472.1 Cysteine-rich flanking region, C-terminal domain and Leucine-rich repeat, typical subtype-containing protein [Strongyloides ratti]